MIGFNEPSPMPQTVLLFYTFVGSFINSAHHLANEINQGPYNVKSISFFSIEKTKSKIIPFLNYQRNGLPNFDKM